MNMVNFCKLWLSVKPWKSVRSVQAVYNIPYTGNKSQSSPEVKTHTFHNTNEKEDLEVGTSPSKKCAKRLD
jgi:hypothetical protein